MNNKYYVPNQDINQIASKIQLNPFNGNFIDDDTIQLYDDRGISINDACVEIWGVDFTDRYQPYVNPNKLRIYRALNEDFDPLTSDFTILGFRKRAPHYDRGRKIRAEYHCAYNDELIVEKIFNDVKDPDTGRLIALQVTFNWYKEDNTIGLTKTEIVKELNKAQAETIERQRRERAIDFLISEARYTPNEPYVTMLMLHYETQINHFKSKAADDFAEALQNETDPTISFILASRVPFASNPAFTVPIKESILYQIGSLDEAGLLATLEPA